MATKYSHNFDLSTDQRDVLNQLALWYRDPNSFITVGGYAGTGKTTMISIFRDYLNKQKPKLKVAFTAFTGKAAQVLQTKLMDQHVFFKQDYIGTIHRLIYTPLVSHTGQIITWDKNESLPYDLIIIDEASMITQQIWNDLQSYKIPIIAVGDHGQLPPIEGEFNLMDKPLLTLEKIHRQAADNPIIQVASLARETGQIPTKQFGPGVLKLPQTLPESQEYAEDIFRSFDQDTLIICGTNKMRIQLNNYVRQIHERNPDMPEVGETVICLKNNYQNPTGPVYNGMIGQLNHIAPLEEHWYDAEIEFPYQTTPYQTKLSRHQFNQPQTLSTVEGLHYTEIGDRFDYGYALTAHKAQGSQAKRVLLFEQPGLWQGQDWNRWLYTAVTRATEELIIIG